MLKVEKQTSGGYFSWHSDNKTFKGIIFFLRRVLSFEKGGTMEKQCKTMFLQKQAHSTLDIA